MGAGLGAAFVGVVGLYSGALPLERAAGPWTALDVEEAAMAERLDELVGLLADEPGAARPRDGDDARAVVARRLARAGWEVEQHEAGDLECRRAGLKLEEEIVLVLARHGAPPRSPGAGLWATSAAVAIELAAAHVDVPCERGLVFAFASDEGGAERALRRASGRGERVKAALVVGSQGRYGGEYDDLPLALAPFVPASADHLLFVADWRGRDALRLSVGAFREGSRLPSEGVALPSLALLGDGAHLSALSAAGVPAVYAGDGGAWRSLELGGPGDTRDKLDAERMARATTGLHWSLRRLTLASVLP
jgi:hypothetical protein